MAGLCEHVGPVSGQLLGYTLERLEYGLCRDGDSKMEVGEETDSKDLLPSAPPTTTGNPSGRAPGVYAANAAEEAVRSRGKGAGHPPLTPASRASTGSPVTGVCRCTSPSCVTLGTSPLDIPISSSETAHLLGLWEKAEQ